MRAFYKRPAVCFLLSICLISSLSAPSLAWGTKGHRIVAIIATEYLSNKARQEIVKLLGSESLASIANDADQIRNSHPETAPWHFVDIENNFTNYDPVRDCAETTDNETTHGDCIIEAIRHFKTVLGDPSESREKRARALIFLVHFIGDLHQPLHCADNHDQGGNEVKVLNFGKRTNLHSIWDS